MFSRSQTKGAKPENSSRQPSFRVWREPLLHFFVLGLAVVLIHRLIEERPEETDDPFLVEVTSGDLEWYRTMFKRRMGREPTVEELRGEVNQLIRERILSREAATLGLDEDDLVVRRRLAQKMEFLLQDLSAGSEPLDDELQSYLEENRSVYKSPGELSFTHIYFSTDDRGEAGASEEAQRVIQQLNTSETSSPDTAQLGDPLLLPTTYQNRSLTDIRSDFGPQFAEFIREQELGRWQGPVPSGFGLHAVRVDQRADARLPELSEIRERLIVDWVAARQRELSRKAYEQVRWRYQVLVEGMPYDMDQGEQKSYGTGRE
jgi:hypothetical protein